jgi:hypothetical protein
MTRHVSDQNAADRIKVLEGHRNQWRRIAFRLFDELRKHDVLAAEEIFASPEPSPEGKP